MTSKISVEEYEAIGKETTKKALEEFCFNKNISLISWFQYGHNGQAFFVN